MSIPTDPLTSRALARIDQLVEQASQVGPEAQRVEIQGWYIRVRTLLNEILPDDNLYLEAIEDSSSAPFGAVGYLQLRESAALLSRLREDLADGSLTPLSILVSGEIFSDLLEMAEHLLENGYHIPAASVAGAVLEDGMRSIAARRNVQWEGQSSIALLNKLLLEDRFYSTVKFKQIDTWNTVRNKADHGEFGAFGPKDVREMVDGVKDFLFESLK